MKNGVQRRLLRNCAKRSFTEAQSGTPLQFRKTV
jgi:hypothetical protein